MTVGKTVTSSVKAFRSGTKVLLLSNQCVMLKEAHGFNMRGSSFAGQICR